MGGFLLEQWHWWSITLLSLTFAGYLLSIKLVWAALASTVVGSILWFNPAFPAMYQIGIFIVFTTLGTALTSVLLKNRQGEAKVDAETEEGEPKQVLRVERLIGHVITLEVPIINGIGQFEIQGATLRLRGEDCKVGERVTVVGVDGIERDRLLVEPLQNSDSVE